MKIFYALLIFSTNLFAQDGSILMLFPGKWKMENEESEIYESWTLFTDSVLVGINYSKDNNEMDINEQILLRKQEDSWEYIAIPNNQDITRFILIEHSPKKFTFENKDHDFPQRIIYEFHKDGKLTAVLEGDIKGELKRKEFSFHLVEE
jgi:hypothetical protein